MKNIHLPVRVSPEEMEEIKAFQQKHKIASRAEAVRQLVYLGLDKPYVAPVREKKRYVSFEDLHSMIKKSAIPISENGIVETVISAHAFEIQLQKLMK